MNSTAVSFQFHLLSQCHLATSRPSPVYLISLPHVLHLYTSPRYLMAFTRIRIPADSIYVLSVLPFHFRSHSYCTSSLRHGTDCSFITFAIFNCSGTLYISFVLFLTVRLFSSITLTIFNSSGTVYISFVLSSIVRLFFFLSSVLHSSLLPRPHLNPLLLSVPPPITHRKLFWPFSDPLFHFLLLS